MAFENILRRLGRNRSRNRQIVSIPQQDWRGVNAVDGIYSMPAHQITPAQNVDLGNPVGSISKVAGYESLFDSLGAGPIRGLHAWGHSDGDKLVFAWDKHLYLLSGDSGSIAKGSQADWEEGAGTNIDTATSSGDIQIAKTGVGFSATATTTADFNGTHSNTEAASNKVSLVYTTEGNVLAYLGTVWHYATVPADYGWQFTVGPNNVTATKLRCYLYKTASTKLKLWRVSDGAKLAEVDVSGVANTWVEGDISATTLTAGASYVVSARIGFVSGDRGYAAGASSYTLDASIASVDGSGNNYGKPTSMPSISPGTTINGIVDVVLSRTSYAPLGTYTHTVQNISGVGTVKTATITFNKTTPASTAVTVEVRLSTNGGATWGAWTTKSSGDTIIASGTDVSNYRVQWRAKLSTTSAVATPSLDDVTIAVTSAYETEASWEHYYDLGVTPSTATLSYAVNAPAGTSVTVFAAGSSNGTVFGDWRLVATSGDAVPRARYIKIKFVMTGTLSATPKASDFLISYSTSYTKPNRLDISPLGRTDNLLTGNRVSFQDYEDRCYCADGLRPFVLYVDDSTVTTGTAGNLIANSLFSDYTGTIDDDTEDTFAGWSQGNLGTGRVEAVTGEFGGVAMKAVQTDATASAQWRGVYQTRTLADMGLAVGDVISVQVRYKMSAFVGAAARLYIYFRDASEDTIGFHDIIPYNPPSTEEQPVYTVKKLENITIPEGTVYIRFYATVRSLEAYSGANNQLWVDYFSCTKSDTVVLASGASAVDDFYNNAFITITAGAGAGQVRFISDYNGSTKIATVSEAWDTVPDGTSKYSISPAVKVRNAGVDPPTTACSGAAGESGSLSGNYRWKYTFVNRDGYESNPSPASGATSLSKQKGSLTNIATGNSTIVARKIYRTKAGGSVYYYVATIENNTATTYTDNTADSGLMVLMPDNNNIPPNCSLVYSFLTYMFYAFKDELWYSKATEPESVPAIVDDVQNIICPGAILDIKSNPMALIPMGEDFIAPITTNSGFIFDSDPKVDTTTMRMIDKNGSFSAWASDMCITPDLRSILVFPTNTGVRTLLPGLQEESIESIPLSRNVQTYFDRAIDRESMAGIYHDGRYRISFKYLAPGASTAEWVTFVCDFRQETREWSGPWTYGASCYVVLDGVLYAGDPQEGKIYRMDVGSSFDGEKIHMIADTQMLAPQGENFTYKFNKFMVMVSAESDTSELVVKPKVDNREVSVVPGRLEDTFTGDKRPGHDNIRSRKYRIPLAKGNTLSLRFEDDSTNPICIQKIITEAEVLPLKR